MIVIIRILKQQMTCCSNFKATHCNVPSSLQVMPIRLLCWWHITFLSLRQVDLTGQKICKWYSNIILWLCFKTCGISLKTSDIFLIMQITFTHESQKQTSDITHEKSHITPQCNIMSLPLCLIVAKRTIGERATHTFLKSSDKSCPGHSNNKDQTINVLGTEMCLYTPNLVA